MEALLFLGLIAFAVYRLLVRVSRNGKPLDADPKREPSWPPMPPPSFLPHDVPIVEPHVPTWTPRVEPAFREPLGTEFRIDTVVRCLAYLRDALPGTWTGVLEPFTIDGSDAVDVVRATNRIAGHVGIRRAQYVVAIGRLEPKLGGLIELRPGASEVFIDVSVTAGRFTPSLLAVLGHELCHKLLIDHGIHQHGPDEQAYEILTDVTAVYMGLGKLLLNGYEVAGTMRDAAGGLASFAHHRFGYLTVDEVAFAHAMTCRIRRHPWAGWSRGLSPFARRCVLRIEQNLEIRHHLDAAPRLSPRTSYVAPS